MKEKATTGMFCWNELATPNAPAAKTFYGQVFGWEFSDHVTGDTTYTIIKHHDQEFAGIWQIPHEQANDVPPHWMSYIAVKSLSESLEKAKKHGATVKVPKTQAGDYGVFAIIIDPTGAAIALWESLKAC